MPIFISFLKIVALDPLNKLYKSAGEKRHEDRSITGQANSELSQTDDKWNDVNRQLDEIGNLKVTTCLSLCSFLLTEK